MKNWKLFFAALFAVVVISCGGGDGSAENLDDLENTDENGTDRPDKIVDCNKKSIEDWDNYIGIGFGENELELENIIGKFTGGEYTTDSSAFIYYFKRVDRAPVTVWVNGKTGNVETIFVEVLGYEATFASDVDELANEFSMKDCDTKWFGMSPDQVIKIMGKASKDEQKADGVRSMIYDSKKFDISVNFKFYDSQEGVCSSISVNWFY